MTLFCRGNCKRCSDSHMKNTCPISVIGQRFGVKMEFQSDGRDFQESYGLILQRKTMSNITEK